MNTKTLLTKTLETNIGKRSLAIMIVGMLSILVIYVFQSMMLLPKFIILIPCLSIFYGTNHFVRAINIVRIKEMKQQEENNRNM